MEISSEHSLHKQNFVHTWTQDKGTVTPQDTEPDLPVSVQDSLAEVHEIFQAGVLEWGAIALLWRLFYFCVKVPED